MCLYLFYIRLMRCMSVLHSVCVSLCLLLKTSVCLSPPLSVSFFSFCFCCYFEMSVHSKACKALLFFQVYVHLSLANGDSRLRCLCLLFCLFLSLHLSLSLCLSFSLSVSLSLLLSLCLCLCLCLFISVSVLSL